MSEADAAAVGSDGPTAGQILKHAREAAGLHVATLAANLKVPVRKLEALEEDRYEELPDAVFVRALASSVCRTLKIDAQPVLQRLPQTAQPRLVPDTDGINAPFRAPGDGPKPGWMGQVTRPVALTVVALLLGAIVLIFLPVAQRGHDENALVAEKSRSPAPSPAEPEAAAPAPVPAAEPAPASAAPVASAAGSAPAAVAPAVTTPAVTTPAVTTPVAPAPAASAPASAAAAAASQPASAAVATTGIVVFRTSGPSWIQVTDAGGTTVLRRLMNAGETAGASGKLPLAVTVGSVAQTQVTVRGKPYDLTPLSHDNVARFQVQ
jgi:cytoskeleton protein RodZ